MKIVIDVPVDAYNFTKWATDKACASIWETLIANGKIIEEGRPILIYRGETVYLTDGHIEAMQEYERKKLTQKAIDSMFGKHEEIKNNFKEKDNENNVRNQ